MFAKVVSSSGGRGRRAAHAAHQTADLGGVTGTGHNVDAANFVPGVNSYAGLEAGTAAILTNSSLTFSPVERVAGDDLDRQVGAVGERPRHDEVAQVRVGIREAGRQPDVVRRPPLDDGVEGLSRTIDAERLPGRRGQRLGPRAEEVLDESVPGSPHVDIHRAKPLSRLGRDEWGLLGEIREIARRRYRP